MASSDEGQGKSQVDVIGIGPITWDKFVIVPRLPGPNERVKAIRIEECAGGISTNILAALRRWKLKCRLVSVVGYDEHSLRIIDDLTQEGLDTDGLLRMEDVEGQANIIIVDNRNGTRSLIQGPRCRSGVLPIRPELLRPWWFENARVLHIETTADDCALEAMEMAKRHHVKVLVTLSDRPESRTGEILRKADWIIAEASVATELTKEIEPSQAAYALHLMSDVPTIVTCGPGGCFYVNGRQTLHQAAVDVPVVDRTGAGAVFHAGFIYGMLAAWEIEKTLKIACWAAGMACREIGGRKGIPTDEQLRRSSHGF
jgi:sugar/nucleoside kinase (ribokinase family)